MVSVSDKASGTAASWTNADSFPRWDNFTIHSAINRLKKTKHVAKKENFGNSEFRWVTRVFRWVQPWSGRRRRRERWEWGRRCDRGYLTWRRGQCVGPAASQMLLSSPTASSQGRFSVGKGRRVRSYSHSNIPVWKVRARKNMKCSVCNGYQVCTSGVHILKLFR